MAKVRVTIAFSGRKSGAIGVCQGRLSERRTIELTDQFTMDEAKEAARVSLYDEYECVAVQGIKFN